MHRSLFLHARILMLLDNKTFHHSSEAYRSNIQPFRQSKFKREGGGTFQVNNRCGRNAAGMKVSAAHLLAYPAAEAARWGSKEGGRNTRRRRRQLKTIVADFNSRPCLLSIQSSNAAGRETQLDRGRKWPPPEILGGLERAEKHGLRQELNANAIAYS